MKKAILALVLVATLGLSGCFFSLDGLSSTYGSTYGAYSTDGTLDYLSLSGFPTGTLYSSTYYITGAGTFDVYYSDYYGGLYYPGNALGTGSLFSSTFTQYYYHYTYTVSNYTSSSKYYWLYLYYYGMMASNTDSYSAKSLDPKAAAEEPATKTLEFDGMTITITREIVKLSPEEAAALKSTSK